MIMHMLLRVVFKFKAFDLTGLIRQPKYGHLKELHRAVKLCEKALVSADPTVTSLGSLQQVLYLYSRTSAYTVVVSTALL